MSKSQLHSNQFFIDETSHKLFDDTGQRIWRCGPKDLAMRPKGFGDADQRIWRCGPKDLAMRSKGFDDADQRIWRCGHKTRFGDLDKERLCM